MKNFTSIDEYIASFPNDIQIKLQKLRTVINESAPNATEAIKYGIPTFILNGNLVHFGAYTNHIGFYPAPRGIEEFKDELKDYIGGKGTVQFPNDKPIPFDLVARIVEFRVSENMKRKK